MQILVGDWAARDVAQAQPLKLAAIEGMYSGQDTLVWVIVCVLGGGAILFPALALLFRLALAGRFSVPQDPVPARAGEGLRAVKPGLLARLAVACLIAGFALLNVANAGWAHAIGIVCLFAFVVAAFHAIIFAALGERASSP